MKKEAPKVKTRKGQKTLTLVIDKETGLPLCALLQAVYNPTGHLLPYYIPTAVWQLSPPKTPMLVTGTREQWESVVPRMVAKAKGRKANSVRKGFKSVNVSFSPEMNF